MDGAKHNTDTLEALGLSVLVNRRAFCAEVFLKGRMERKAMRILVIVGSDSTENVECRKSKVSLAIYFSQGLISA